jgi:ferric-dicitrate binding protein FerR (iron transport regulator)
VWTRALRTGVPANQVALRTVATKNAQRASLTLVDGSTVILAPASRLRYASDFGTNTRDVYLEGEAYFDVVHDGDHAFAVHTATAITKDLGTSFSVHAYASDTTVRVVVAEGSVELRADHLPSGRRGAVLTAGQLGRLASDGTALVQPAADVSRYLAWTRGRLVFDDTPLGEAVPQLERWYDIELRLADPSLARLSLTGSYKDEPIAEVIQNIALALNLRVEHHGGTIFLAAKHAAQ